MGRHGTIAGRKAAQDTRRAAMFTKYARVITVAAKAGGDPDFNPSLRTAIEKAKGVDMPNANIDRAIKKGTGELAGETYESGTFEGYGPAGVAVIVEVLTDNKNRTTSAVKHAFDKWGGNMGTPGCVSYMFKRKGLITIEKTDDVDEESLMDAALEAGMEDMNNYEDSFEIVTQPEDYLSVCDALKEAGYAFADQNIEYVPDMEQTPTDEHDIDNLKRMISVLEEDDDVQNVYHNCTVDLES